MSNSRNQYAPFNFRVRHISDAILGSSHIYTMPIMASLGYTVMR